MIGGTIEMISLDGSSFSVPEDVDCQIKMGGFENEVLANGDGTGRVKRMRVMWSVKSGKLAVSFADGDPALIQELADRGTQFPIVIKLADDSKLNGVGTIIGEVVMSSAESTATLELSGSGTLSQ